ncbi:MAG: response regulator [Proteobacteria bacterium]|nr:response regulator [Pseudomonadota bacterium]
MTDHPPEQPASPPAGGVRGRILVVDDDYDVRNVAVETLVDAGYEVLEAGTAHDAFKILQDHGDIDLVFTDIMMPGIDGFKLAGMVRMSSARTRVLFATGYMDLAQLNPAFLHGDLLNKPYRPSDLVAAVAKVLSYPS